MAERVVWFINELFRTFLKSSAILVTFLFFGLRMLKKKKSRGEMLTLLLYMVYLYLFLVIPVLIDNPNCMRIQFVPDSILNYSCLTKP